MVATSELMLALIKGVVDVGVVLSLKPILKSWQLCLLFKLDVLTMNYCLHSHSSLYVPNNLYQPYNIDCIILIKSIIINKVDYIASVHIHLFCMIKVRLGGVLVSVGNAIP